MVLYTLTGAFGETFDLYIVSNMSFGGEQSVVVYESPGSDGGVLLTTGRLNKKVTLTGQIFSKETDEDAIRTDLNQKIQGISDWRDNAMIVKLKSPITHNDTGFYIIKTFGGNVTEGQLRAVAFTMELEEYRQKGVKRAEVNLVNYQPAELLKQRARDRNIIAG